ncbi:hypothetical protein Tco_1389036, partial [Tanacetum coccineum]
RIMNPQETQQVTTHDEKWVPSIERVKISSANFWYIIKKVNDSESNEFLLANKKCIVDDEVFRTILDICPRVEGEEYTSEYGLAILDMMLNDAIKQSESYQIFIKYSTSQITPKKSRGKGSQGKKTFDVSQETVDNIIPDPDIDLDVALELGKFISITKAEVEEAARQVHATHARMVTKSVSKPAKIKTGSRTLKESKKTGRRQPGTRGSGKETCRIPGVPDESTVASATSTE